MKHIAVRETLDRLGRDENDLRSLRSRLSALVPERRLADMVLTNVGLLEWIFRLPNPERLALEESLMLTERVRTGRRGWHDSIRLSNSSAEPKPEAADYPAG